MKSMITDFLFGESDSPPIASGEGRTTSRVFVELLSDLSRRRADSFCTFEVVGAPHIWFQVNGASLSEGNCAWPLGLETVEATLGRLDIDVPECFRLVADENYGETRVVTFQCAPLRPEEWAVLIDAIFCRVLATLPNYEISGWITRA